MLKSCIICYYAPVCPYSNTPDPCDEFYSILPETYDGSDDLELQQMVEAARAEYYDAWRDYVEEC